MAILVSSMQIKDINAVFLGIDLTPEIHETSKKHFFDKLILIFIRTMIVFEE